MTQEEKIYYEIERRGNRITSYELMTLGIMQYQARMKGLREKLAKKNIILTEAEPIINQKRNYLYRIIKQQSYQIEMNLSD
jgi:RNA binding exosome subunit